MAIIERRIFYAKLGKANEVVRLSCDMSALLQRFDLSFGVRTLNDYMSGRADRVVVETEFESSFGQVWSEESTVEEFKEVEARLLPLLYHAEVEQWTVV